MIKKRFTPTLFNLLNWKVVANLTLRALLTFYCTFFHPNILRHTSRLIIFFSCGCKTKRQGINYGGQWILSKNVLQDSRHKMQTDLRLHPILTGLLYFNFSETKKDQIICLLFFYSGQGFGFCRGPNLFAMWIIVLVVWKLNWLHIVLPICRSFINL